MSETKDVLILAIESSCDETAAAVVKNGRDCTAYSLWGCCAGNRIQKTYRKDQPGD